MDMRIGAIEAGGTKFVCGVGNERGEWEDKVSFPTEFPEPTLRQVIAYFQDKNVDAIGIGSFGPVDLDRSSPTYGSVTTTPKPGWNGYPFLAKMKEAFDVPFGWDTDVNAAAYAETVWGAAKGLDSCVYYTIGTGIGVGIYADGKPIHGMVHPEAGHVYTRRHPDDAYEGFCPYHGDCLEGLAAGPAIEKRWKLAGRELHADHQAWAMEAYYIGQSVATTILMLSPRKIVLGGGVMKQEQLFPLVHAEVRKQLNGYVNHENVLTRIEEYIVPSGLDGIAGLYGSLALGVDAYRSR